MLDNRHLDQADRKTAQQDLSPRYSYASSYHTTVHSRWTRVIRMGDDSVDTVILSLADFHPDSVYSWNMTKEIIDHKSLDVQSRLFQLGVCKVKERKGKEREGTAAAKLRLVIFF